MDGIELKDKQIEELQKINEEQAAKIRSLENDLKIIKGICDGAI